MIELYWKRNSGCFVNKLTGDDFPGLFTGNQLEWNETLVETIIDACGKINSATEYDLHVSPELFSILSTSILYRYQAPMTNGYRGLFSFTKFKMFLYCDTKYFDEIPRNEVHIKAKNDDFVSGKVVVLDL